MTTQLRMFRISERQMDAFVAAWLAGVYPLRLRYGFRTEGAWRIDATHQFLWLLSYSGPETFEEQDQAYYASTERTRLDPDPAQYIERVEVHFVTSVLPETP